MDKPELKALEDAIEFGKTIAGIDHLLGHTIYVFGSTMFSDEMKRKTAADLDGQRQFVQGIIETVDQKYTGIKVAEEAKTYAGKKLAELEEAARPYLG